MHHWYKSERKKSALLTLFSERVSIVNIQCVLQPGLLMVCIVFTFLPLQPVHKDRLGVNITLNQINKSVKPIIEEDDLNTQFKINQDRWEINY